MLTNKRMVRKVTIVTMNFAATASQSYYQGGVVGLDSSTGLLDKVPTADVPLGLVVDTVELGSGGGNVLVRLFDEADCVWFKVDNSITDADIGAVAHYREDDTVSTDNAYGSNPEAGVIFAVDSAKGALVKVN